MRKTSHDSSSSEPPPRSSPTAPQPLMLLSRSDARSRSPMRSDSARRRLSNVETLTSRSSAKSFLGSPRADRLAENETLADLFKRALVFNNIREFWRPDLEVKVQGLKEWRVINVAATKESVAPRCVYAIGCPDAFGDGNKIHVYTSKRADSADGGVQTMEDATLFPAELHSRMERSTQFTQAEHAVGIISELECNLRSVVFCKSICAIFDTHLPKTPAVDLLDAEFGPGGLHSICFETHNVSLPRIQSV